MIVYLFNIISNNMNDIKNDIFEICSDFINYNENVTLYNLLEYSLDILTIIYSNDKYFYKKNIYPEYIKQLICEEFTDIFGYHYNYFTDVDYTNIVNKLKEIPQVEQRSPEWFKLRGESIGASESASIFGKNIFSNEKELLLKKCGHKKPFTINPACMHGTKYEPIIQMMYEIKTGRKLEEYGSIKHPILPMISASPDGITPEGRMIEIKAPWRRKITGIPPVYYWIQMQQQLQVCGLDVVDFIECKISEFINRKEYFKDTNGKDFETKTGCTKNILIEYYRTDSLNNSTTDWVYPNKLLTDAEIPEWIKNTKEKFNRDATRSEIFSRTIYFKIDQYSASEVWRDNDWWNKNKNKYVLFWDKVENLRNNKKNLEEMIHLQKKPPPVKRKPKYLIIDETNDDTSGIIKSQALIKRKPKCLIIDD